MSHIIGDAPEKMKKAIENVACQCGHPRDDHENRVGKCKHKVDFSIGYRLKGKKKILTEAELLKVRKSKKLRAKLEVAYDKVPCCNQYRPIITRAGFTDQAFSEIFGGMPAIENHRPPEGTAISKSPADPKPKDLTTVESNSDPDVIVKKSSGSSVQLIDPSAGRPPQYGEEFSEEVQDLEGRNLVSPEHKEQVLTAPHKPKVATITNAAGLVKEVCKLPVGGSGLANWFTGLGADILSFNSLGENPQKTVENYDWIMVNISGIDIGVSWKIREWLGTGSDTKLIVNNDYAIEVLQNIIHDVPKASLYRFIKDILSADLFFAQEPYELNAINYIIQWNKDKVRQAGVKSHHPITTMISHPVDTPKLKQFAVDDMNARSPTIGVMYHRLDGQVFIPSMITRWQPPSWFNGMTPLNALYSYMGKANIYASEDRLFDIHYEHLDFGRYVQMFVPNIAALDYYTIHSHSRFSSECACFKVPLVSTTHSYNASTLFPNNVAPYDNWQALREKLARVISDEKYWQECVQYAYEQVEQFNIPNSITKLATVMEIVAKRR